MSTELGHSLLDGYGYDGAIDHIRQEQYPQLKDNIYLDHAGATLPSKHLVQGFSADLTSNLYANPHSMSPSSLATSARVESARQKVLQHFKASVNGEWDVIFTANATAGIKLVGDAFPWTRTPSENTIGDLTSSSSGTIRRSKLTVLREAHTSVVGLRSFVQTDSGDSIDYQTITSQQVENTIKSDAVQSPQPVQGELCKSHKGTNPSHHPSPPLSPFPQISNSPSGASLPRAVFPYDSTTPVYNLFAYPAQCNFGGRRFPLQWTKQLKDRLDTDQEKTLVLLDAASMAMTSELDLSDLAASPDFIVISFYKMFGLPTGLGAVIVKTKLQNLLRKRYFGGGTVSAITSDVPWQVYRTSLHGRFEDGTLNFLDIVALDMAFDSMKTLYGSFSRISAHVTALHRLLYNSMRELVHYNGSPLCMIYVDNNPLREDGTNGDSLIGDPKTYGPILNFNLKRSNGQWIGYGDVERLASMKRIHLRTGGFCNPGSMQRWLNLTADEVKSNLAAGHVCWDDTDILNGKPTGSVRVSLGAMTTLDDIESFIAFLKEYFIDHSNPDAAANVMDSVDGNEQHLLNGSADHVQVDTVIIYPIKSCQGFKIPRDQAWPIAPHGLLYDREWMLVDEVTGSALTQKRYPRMCMIRAEVLLDQNMMVIEHDTDEQGVQSEKLYISLSDMPAESAQNSSRVCGECATVVHYTSPEINAWFTRFLGKPCRLARQPTPSHEPSPTSGDAENAPRPSRFVKSHLNAPTGAPILLSNESPFLLISDKSVERVREWVDEHDDGQGAVRRLANLSEGLDARKRHEFTSDSFRANFVTRGQEDGFEEDSWERIQIGRQVFDGQIFFGVHMLHRPDLSVAPYVVKAGDSILTTSKNIDEE
ncbi:hypothetical protein BGW38_007940 [Lunasporangiospora selenospora]|uniref:Molybdenum cofactor sulfurase n=1 Tax=Lunasporangiospora selenospora TaxID=979761 RepID=A0A9P6FYA6_9FUNG|nr:hypothetical protein BGW38_007940 [Lunasporangiospora selenospora]